MRKTYRGARPRKPVRSWRPHGPLGEFRPGSLLDVWDRTKEARAEAYRALILPDCFLAADYLEIAVQGMRELRERGAKFPELSRLIDEDRADYAYKCARAKPTRRRRFPWFA